MVAHNIVYAGKALYVGRQKLSRPPFMSHTFATLLETTSPFSLGVSTSDTLWFRANADPKFQNVVFGVLLGD